MPNIDYNSQSKNYTKLNKRLAGYIKEIQLIFQQLNHEGCKIALDLTDISDNLDKVLDFSKYPQTKDRLNKLMTKYQKGISSVVVSSMQAEYKKGELDQDTLANNLIERCNNKLPDSAPKLSKKTSTIITSSTDKAKDSFLNRANRGFNLKSKLALQSKEYIKELESAISVAIGKGTDAKTLSKQVTNLFLDYAKLDKEYKLKFGEPIPSKNIQYQAMRLARSEINMAYRDAEQARWRDMPFVIGYEIVLSNNHNCKGVPKGHFYDICDDLAGKYPKDFKWLGWHPNCRCHAVPIMMTDEQFIQWNNGKQVNAATIDKMPKKFDKWLEQNKDRIERATQRGTLPYFLRDNKFINTYSSAESLNKMASDAGRIVGHTKIDNYMANKLSSNINYISRKIDLFPKSLSVVYTDKVEKGTLMSLEGNKLSISKARYKMDNGTIFCPVDDLQSAFSKLVETKNIENLTFNEEYAIECLFHESIHSRQLKLQYEKNVLNNFILEIATQLYARNGYTKILKFYKRESKHFDAIQTDGYGYKEGCKLLRKYFTKNNALQIGELINIANGSEDGTKILRKKLTEYGLSKDEQSNFFSRIIQP